MITRRHEQIAGQLRDEEGKKGICMHHWRTGKSMATKPGHNLHLQKCSINQQRRLHVVTSFGIAHRLDSQRVCSNHGCSTHCIHCQNATPHEGTAGSQIREELETKPGSPHLLSTSNPCSMCNSSRMCTFLGSIVRALQTNRTLLPNSISQFFWAC